MESARLGDLARNLRRLREVRGLSRTGLADLAGVSRSYIAGLEIGRVTNPGVYPLYGVAEALGTTIEALIGRPGLVVMAIPRDGRERYTLHDAQDELEARLHMVGARPFEVMTAAQLDAYAPPSLIDHEELISAATAVVDRYLAASLGHPAEWSAISFYITGVLAMALVGENSR